MRIIHTGDAPAAIGPYSQAVIAKGLCFCSGQIGMDPETGEMVLGGVEAQTHRAILNLSAVLQEAGSSLNHVVKVTVYLKDMGDFSTMNSVYEQFFNAHRPARAAVEVARLPKDALVELDAIAVV